MDTKRFLTDQIIEGMSSTLDDEQLRTLGNVVLSKLSNVRIEVVSTVPACTYNVNDKYLRLFVASRRLEGLSEKSLRQYVFYTTRFLDAVDKNFTDVVTTDIQLYLANYEKTRNVCRCTLDNMRKAINSFFLWLFENDYIQKNPASNIKSFAFEKKPILILSDMDILNIRDYVYGDYRTRAIIETLLATGIRVSELCNILISDIDLNSAEITIHCAKKRQKQDRHIFLTVEAIKAINEYLIYRNSRGWTQSPYLFVANRKGGGPLNERLINEKLHDIETALDLPIRLTVHVFRKTLASLLYRRGMQPLDIAYILGHADSRMSETYYISVRGDEVKRNYSRYR